MISCFINAKPEDSDGPPHAQRTLQAQRLRGEDSHLHHQEGAPGLTALEICPPSIRKENIFLQGPGQVQKLK